MLEGESSGLPSSLPSSQPTQPGSLPNEEEDERLLHFVGASDFQPRNRKM